jgi:hypothetical protein
VNAQFAGDANHTPSSASVTLNVVSTAKIKVNLQLVAYKVVNVKVDILQGSTVVATRTVTLTPGSRTASMSFTLNAGIYTVRVSGYSIATQTNGPFTIPPDKTVSFNIS